MKAKNAFSNMMVLLAVIEKLGGMATTTKIKDFVQSQIADFKVKDVRKYLRMLERKGLVRADRPFPDKLELRWQIIEQATQED